MDSLIISADEMKKEIEGYSPEKAELFHSQSAKLADKKLVQVIKDSQYQQVILLCGGPASGKTEYVSEYLMSASAIVVDGILPTVEGAKVKIRNIKKAGKHLSVHVVIPDDLKRAFTAFLHRDRKFSDEHFYSKHSSSRATALYVAEHYLELEMRIFKSTYEANDLYFTELIFEDRLGLVEFLSKNQLTETQIIQLVAP